ncbi:hypothetical protein KOR34_52870 [Posidoniimonas corsicana]|uniref:Uncharacterized protein n=1 Tax=Posidoniimonas corsicana TaxID=1938618 RepID=A0A5C5UUS1_9BACT|nr:hypothetical protein [Posidoniimonas corsicana]TWT29232.1 hypothetical protein KOR34_52870 [Posidoniimonas corsicana]
MQIAREAYARAATRHIDLADLPRAEPLWVPAGLMAVLLTLVSALGAFGGEVSDSGWRSTGPTPQATPSRRVQEFRPVSRAAEHKRSVNRGRVRLVAFDPDADGSQVVQAQHGAARLRSIVVDQNGQRRGYRVAQDDDLLQGFEQPFGSGETPADNQPGLDQPMFEEPVLDEPTFSDPIDDPLPPLDDEPTRDPFDEPRVDPATPSPSDDQARDMFDDDGGLQDVAEDDLRRPPTQIEHETSADYQRAMKDCAEELAELKASRINEISLAITPEGDAGEDYPFECGIDDGTPFADRQWPQVCYMWKASALCHKPLYFENVQLERYGHSWGPCLQPIVSGVHFFARIPAIPYMMGIQTPNECVYTLGHYRPGSCAPYMIEPIPFTWRAAAFQGAAVTGAVFAIP